MDNYISVTATEHLWTACVRQWLPDPAENSTYRMPSDLTFPGIPIMYLRSLSFFKSHPPCTTSFLWHDRMHKHLWIPSSWAGTITVRCIHPRPLALAGRGEAAISKDVSRPVVLGKRPNQPAPYALWTSWCIFLDSAPRSQLFNISCVTTRHA